MRVFGKEPVARGMGSWVACAGATLVALFLAGGCTPASSSANAVATAAAVVTSAVAAATQPTTQPVNVAVAKSSKSIVGRWIYRKPFSYGDGNPAPDALAVIEFNKDGSYESSSHAGYGPTLVIRGTFQAFGTLLTTHVGKATTSYTYHIQDAHLTITNAKTKQAITYERG